MLFSSMIIVQRSFAVETADGALDALRVAGADMSAVFWGKWFALIVQLVILEVVLIVGAIVMYGIDLRISGLVLLVTSSISATCGLSAVSTIYAGLASGVCGVGSHCFRFSCCRLHLLSSSGRHGRRKRRLELEERWCRKAGRGWAFFRCSPLCSVSEAR